MAFLARRVIARCKRFNGVVGTITYVPRINCSTITASMTIKENAMPDIYTVTAVLHSPDELKSFLFKRFSQEKDCYTYAISLLSANYPKSKAASIHSSLQILQVFSEWLKSNEATEALSYELKAKAVDAALAKLNYKLLRMVCDVYQMGEHREDINNMIDRYLGIGNIEYAAYIIMTLDMQDEIPFEKIAIPLLMSSNFALCKQYFDKKNALLSKFVRYIDDLLGKVNKNTTIIDGVKINGKAIYKYITVLLNHRLISENVCPNAMRIQTIGTMHLLLRKRKEKAMTEKSWEEMIMSFVQNDDVLQRMLVEFLISKNEIQAASKIAEKFSIPFDASSVPIVSDQEEQIEKENATQIAGVEGAVEYLSLELDPGKIKFITTEQDFIKCVNHLSQPGSIIGVDSEWKPNFNRGTIRLSLMQLAVEDQVYILDILALRKCLNTENWDDFLCKIFSNPDVLKLGCGITQDVQMLVDGKFGSRHKPIRFSHILDLALLFQKMEPYYPGSSDGTSNMKGLSKLCEFILGKPLNKEGRFCNWEDRPLTEQQINYAALDAYCLLQMFESLKAKAESVGKDFHQLMQSAIFNTVSISRAATKIGNVKWSRTGSSFSYDFFKGVNNFKVVVESSLESIGLKLRMYGVDVAVKDLSDICKDSFKVVNEESRVVIGDPSILQKVKGTLSEDKYYIVENQDVDKKNVVAVIFQRFNIQMSPNSIFSRCMKCNNIEFRDVPSDSLKAVYECYSKIGDEHFEPKLPSSESQALLSELDVKIQFDKIRASDFSSVKTFKVCVKCGNVQFQR